MQLIPTTAYAIMQNATIEAVFINKEDATQWIKENNPPNIPWQCSYGLTLHVVPLIS